MSADSRTPSDAGRPDPDVIRRIEDLLADRAMQGLPLQDEQELEQHLARVGELDVEAFDRAAAAVDLALSSHKLQPMPDALKQRIAASMTGQTRPTRSEQHSAIAESARGPRTEPPPKPRSSFVMWSGWIAAAAAIVVTLFLARPSSVPGTSPGATPPAAASIVEQVGAAKDHVSARWKPTEDPASKSMLGNIEWSNTLQKGYMRFTGLAKNDPTKQQYQLWIFDGNQSDKYPIDGGVFDIDKDTGDVIVPIDAKIKVVAPTMFALTLEKPGGVVVSTREKLMAVAKL